MSQIYGPSYGSEEPVNRLPCLYDIMTHVSVAPISPNLLVSRTLWSLTSRTEWRMAPAC